jgi:predicted metal-binding membrane protein
MTTPVEALLKRQRTVTLAALAVLALLAWGWLALGAGMGMAPRADLDIFAPPAGMALDMPGMAIAGAPGWSVGRVLLSFSMWWVMMLAMMLPAAAPVILLHGVASRKSAPDEPAATGAFLAGYLAIWGLFSLAAALMQLALEQSGLLAPMLMAASGRWLTVLLLVAAGLYQLSPLKEACLRHCRNPASFLARHYRPGRGGAFRLGTIHGAWCLGCCWLLMALLFVGGVMNLAWIALLTLLVAGEKLLPGGRVLAIVAGLAFLGWAAWLAFG